LSNTPRRSKILSFSSINKDKDKESGDARHDGFDDIGGKVEEKKACLTKDHSIL